jgi:hypothetical protein
MTTTITQHKPKVFLGGTCNRSTWRDELIILLSQRWLGYFNPVIEEGWTDVARLEEIEQRKNCDFCLYVLTPEMVGFYSIAEVVDDSNKRPEKVILCILKEANGLKFDDKQYRSLMAVADMVVANGGVVLENLQKVAEYVQVKGYSLGNKTLSLDSPAAIVDHRVNVPFNGPNSIPTQVGFRSADANPKSVFDIPNCPNP